MDDARKMFFEMLKKNNDDCLQEAKVTSGHESMNIKPKTLVDKDEVLGSKCEKKRKTTIN